MIIIIKFVIISVEDLCSISNGNIDHSKEAYRDNEKWPQHLEKVHTYFDRRISTFSFPFRIQVRNWTWPKGNFIINNQCLYLASFCWRSSRTVTQLSLVEYRIAWFWVRFWRLLTNGYIWLPLSTSKQQTHMCDVLSYESNR